MNSIFVIALVATLSATCVLAGQAPDQVMEYYTACTKELNLTESDFNQLAASKTFEEVNDKSKCFFNFFQEYEETFIGGVLQEAKVIELFEGSVGAKKAREIFEICSKVKGAENCETAFKLHICYRENGIF